MTDHENLSQPTCHTCAQLAHVANDLERELLEVMADRNAYRELATETLHALAALTTKLEHQRARYHALLNARRPVPLRAA
ncbi:MAG: hypothetical protein ABR606_00625 [Vicinamibacterales bacterium]